MDFDWALRTEKRLDALEDAIKQIAGYIEEKEKENRKSEDYKSLPYQK